MPVATPEVYAEMIDRAKAGKFAYPAINVSSSQTINAALQGFAEAGSDGILQISTTTLWRLLKAFGVDPPPVVRPAAPPRLESR